MLTPFIIYFQHFSVVKAHFGALYSLQPVADYSQMTLNQLLTAVFIVLLAMTGIVHFWRNSSADRIRIRQFYGLFTMITIVAAVALFLLPQYYDFLLRLLIINTAPLIAHFLTLTNTRITNIAFYVICATALILTAINLWIPSLSF